MAGQGVNRRVAALLAAAAAAATAGCMSAAGKVAEIEPRFSKPLPDEATLAIDRSDDFNCRISFVQLSVDGQYAGQIGPGAGAHFHVPAGAHIVSANASGRCQQDPVSTWVILAASQSKALRTGFDTFGNIHLELAEGR